MDGESGELTEWEEVVGAWTGRTETEGLKWGWRRELGSWFQRQGEAYRKERGWCWRSSEVNDRWRASAARSLNRDEVIMQIWRLDGCEDFVSEWQEFVFDAFGYFERKIGVMWQDLGALTTARAREFWICCRRVIWDLGITVIEFGVNDGGVSGGSCGGIEVRTIGLVQRSCLIR